MTSLAHEALRGDRPFTVKDVRALSAEGYALEARPVRDYDRSPTVRYATIVNRMPKTLRRRAMPLPEVIWKYTRRYSGMAGTPGFLPAIADSQEDLVEALNDERCLVKVVDPGAERMAA